MKSTPPRSEDPTSAGLDGEGRLQALLKRIAEHRHIFNDVEWVPFGAIECAFYDAVPDFSVPAAPPPQEPTFGPCNYCGWISKVTVCQKCGRERESGIRLSVAPPQEQK